LDALNVIADDEAGISMALAASGCRGGLHGHRDEESENSQQSRARFYRMWHSSK
jgi:hypothetical protein